MASSLTEFFSPDIMARRIAAWETHYPWVEAETLAYFRGRVTRAKEDSREAIDYVLANKDGTQLFTSDYQEFLRQKAKSQAEGIF